MMQARLRVLYKISMGETILNEDLTDTGLPVYSATAEDKYFGKYNKSKLCLSVGDLVVGARGTIGAPKLVREPCTSTQTTIVMQKNSPLVESRFIRYWMLANSESVFWYDKTAIPQLTVARLGDFKILLPTLEEQVRIANFLDAHTARIDMLILQKQALCSKLKELKKSSITAFVTGKYSAGSQIHTGNRFYPTLPVGWTVGRVKHVAACMDGKRVPLSGEERGARQGTYPYYGASEVIDHVDAYIFDEPLILVGEDGANLINRTTPLAFVADGKYWVNNHAHVLKPHDGLVNYWAYALESLDVTDWVCESMMPKLTYGALMNLPIAIPPLQVRHEIEKKLRELMQNISNLYTHTQDHMMALTEYKAALISHAVTGSIASLENLECQF